MDQAERIEKNLQILLTFFNPGKKYTLTFNQHTATDVLLECRKALVAEISKIVEKTDGKTPKCFLLQFEHFRTIINLQDIQSIDSIVNGIRIRMEYDLLITYG